MSIPTIAVGALSAALIVAWSGGSQAPEPLNALAATQYAADASVIGADASSALDATLLTVTQLVPGTASTPGAGRKPSPAKGRGALNCAAGGAATMTITGTYAVNELNGSLDAGEVYQIAFIDCRGSVGQPVLNGTVTMNVATSAGGITAVDFSTTTLKARLPRGAVSFIGSASVQRTLVKSGNPSSVSTRVTASSLDVTTDVNGRAGHFTLGSVDLVRHATYSAGVLLSSSCNGTHTLAGTWSGKGFEFNVATQGDATFSAGGVPTQGAWTITLPNQIVALTLADGTAAITIDEGKDGSIDDSLALPILQLTSDAG